MHIAPSEFKRMRLSLGLTQAEAARLLGYSAATRISEVENGRAKPGASTVLLLEAYVAGYRPEDWPDK